MQQVSNKRQLEWTNNCILRLIEEYRKRPMLWDTDHILYRTQTAKYEAYAEMADIFGCSIVDLRRKLNSISASYRREKAKIRSGGRSYWFLYPLMKFLPNHLNTPPRKKATSKSTDAYYEEEHLDESLEETFESSIHEEITIKEEAVQSEPVKPRRGRHITHKPRLLKRTIAKQITPSQLDHRLVEAVKLLRRSELAKKKDECDSFGEYIAVSLRKHDERTQSMIKQAINNILFEQEMKKYNSSQYVVLPGMDENPLTLSDNENSEK